MPSSHSKKILIVPLDWGLGHTTRCIPIIKVLIGQGHQVHIGGTRVTNTLLKSEFPELNFYLYPSYGISYPNKGDQFLRHIVRQIPHMARVVRDEQRLTKQLNNEHQFDIIISDNRFGVRANKCLNIFISHQLSLSIPQSYLAQRLANWINQRFINKFDRVAVPDWDHHLLSGILSEKGDINKPLYYLGNLSRWQKSNSVSTPEGLLIILSGPEPQRSLFEELVILQSDKITMPISIVRAKPMEMELPEHSAITFYNHLPANELLALAEKNQVIISRAGYSTVMDLVAINKHAILIPTPGQTEQEYLVEHLNEMNLFTFYSQTGFNLAKAVKEFKNKKWGEFPISEISLEERIRSLIE